MLATRDIMYIVGLLLTLGSAGWWLSSQLSAIRTMLTVVVDEFKDFRSLKLAERVAVLEERLLGRRPRK